MSASGQRWHPDSEAVNAVAAVSPEWRFMVEFSYHDVTPQGQPVERNEESCRSYARVHPSSTDRQELYLEVVRFHDLKPEEEYLQHRRYLEQRLFTRFSDVTNEILEARIWAGIHFRNADVQAAELGRDVARYIHTHFFAAAH